MGATDLTTLASPSPASSDSPTDLYAEPSSGPSATFGPGELLGERYRIESLLGRGGMGEVWRAYDLKLRLEVALKILHPKLFDTEEGLELLRDEVRAAREVTSPNVCRLYDLVEVGERELVSMEYVDGVTLLEHLREGGPLELKEANEVASQLLAGLEAIHQAGLVHRDIKPENVMLTRAGRVVVMDFGLTSPSGTGSMAGTPAYMAPEQARGQAVDSRADVFSAGMVLAEMLSAAAGPDESSRQTFWRSVRQQPPVVPESPWKPILQKALAAEKGSRFASAQELARALEEVAFRVEGAEHERPYPGLASFQEEEAEFFFGREAEVEAVWKKLAQAHLLGLIGPSGSGKSSFLNAGLLPAKPEGWSCVRMSPGRAPYAALGRVLLPELEVDAEGIEALVALEDSDSALRAFRHWRSSHRGALLIVDQFEELFTQCSEEVQQRFAELLGRAALDADIHVLLSMRDDFLMHCRAHEALAPLFADLTALLPPMGSALRRAVVQPALRCGYRFADESVVEEMLEEVTRERGALPLIAFTAAQLWERRDQETGYLTREAYDDLGGVGGALAQHAEATLERSGSEHIPVVRELFRNLVTAQGTRAARDREELLSVFDGREGETKRPASVPAGEGGGREAPSHVLDTLIDARLLTSYQVPAQEEDGSPRHRIEIVHESLLSNWPRLVRWRTQDQEGAQLRDELRHQARVWEEKGRPDDLLWSGTSFQEFQLWRSRYPGGLTSTEEEFARAMTVHAERRRRRRRIVLAATFVLLLTVLAIVGGFWRRSVAEARRAEASKLLALAQLGQEEDPTAALAYTTASLELADTEEARIFALRLLWEAPPALETEPHDQGVRFPSFSPDGTRLATGGHTDNSWVWTAEGGSPLVVPGQDTRSYGGNSAAWASNGLLVTGICCGNAPRTHIWRLPEGERVRTIEFDAPAYWEVAGDRLFAEVMETDAETGHEIYHLRAWSLPDGEAVELGTVDLTALGPGFDISICVFDFSGRGWIYARGNEIYYRPLPVQEGVPDRFVGRHDNDAQWGSLPDQLNRVWTRDAVTHELRLWDLSSSKAEPLRVVGPPTGLEEGATWWPFDPSGRWALGSLWGTGARQARVWNLEAWPEARPFTLKRSGSWFGAQGRFHPTGEWLVVSTHGYTRLTLWPLRGVWPSVVDGYSNPWRPLAFSPDSRWLATVWPDNSLRLWPLPGSGARDVKSLPLPPEAEGALWRDLVFDPQGRFVFVVAHSVTAYVVPLDGSPPRRLEGLPESRETLLAEAAVSPSGRQVATAFRRGGKGEGPRVLWVWNLETGELRLFDLPEVPSPDPNREQGVWDLAFADDSTLYTSGIGGVRRWDLDTGAHDVVLATQVGSSLTWSGFGPGARTAFVMVPMIGGEYLGPARVLDLVTGDVRDLSTFAKVRLRSSELWPRNAFDATDTLAATGDADGIIRVAPLSGGEPHLLVGHEGPVDYLAISPDGRWVASTGEDNTLRLWPMPDLDQPPRHTLPHDAFVVKLKSLTNIRVVRDPESAEGWKVELDPFPGWAEVPSW